MGFGYTNASYANIVGQASLPTKNPNKHKTCSSIHKVVLFFFNCVNAGKTQQPVNKAVLSQHPTRGFFREAFLGNRWGWSYWSQPGLFQDRAGKWVLPLFENKSLLGRRNSKDSPQMKCYTVTLFLIPQSNLKPLYSGGTQAQNSAWKSPINPGFCLVQFYGKQSRLEGTAFLKDLIFYIFWSTKMCSEPTTCRLCWGQQCLQYEHMAWNLPGPWIFTSRPHTHGDF